MPSQACLDNVKKVQPPIYCDEIAPGACEKIQLKIDKYCRHQGLPPNAPIPQEFPAGRCWCCCGCQEGTALEVEPGLYKQDAAVEVGETVMTTGPDLQGWERRAVTERAEMAVEAQTGFVLAGRFRFESGLERTVVATEGHLFLRGGDGLGLSPMRDLQSGDSVRQADGGVATVELVSPALPRNGVRHFALGAWEPGQPLDGHLMNANGLIIADLAVQLAHYGGALPPDLVVDSASAPNAH